MDKESDTMTKLSNLKGQLLVEQIEGQIHDFIVNEPIPVGKKLPNEFDLGERFNAGRSTIREAIKALQFKGIVEVRRGSGTYVKSYIPIDDDPLGILKVEDKEAIAMDLVEARLMIEPAMAEMAALRATKEDIEKLTLLCDVVEQKILSGESYSKEDIAFHCCVAECSKNKIVEQLIPIIDTAVMMFVNLTQKQLKKETIQTHRAVADAIRDHDSVGARTAMTMHMAYNRALIKSMNDEKQKSEE